MEHVPRSGGENLQQQDASVTLQEQVHEQLEQSVEESQRRYFLGEQLKQIKKELGIVTDDRSVEMERFQHRLQSLSLSADAERILQDEMSKFSVLEPGSPEYNLSREYLDWMTGLPWGKYSDDVLDLDHAREILNREHCGLDDVKQRILEFLAVGVFKGEISGSIMLLVGPPGVGKTSIGRSIADALGRKFFRFSVGGLRDEAEIKGHRRTHVAATPGKFIQAIHDCGVANPVVMIDEIDKVGNSFSGNPASALLEVLDPDQNIHFTDRYLGTHFDLSKVLFVCTANQLFTVPGALLDRMEIVRLAGYIMEEKLDIAKNHLWPRQLRKVNAKPSRIRLSDAALRTVIEGYAREAGVRGLDRSLSRIVRKAVYKLLEEDEKSVRIGAKDVEEYLGLPVFRGEELLSGVGVVTGLAWTAMGGIILPVEATVVSRNKSGFKLTGKLGDVMRESAEIAYSFVSANLKKFKADEAIFNSTFVHLHVPQGAISKDGPSAGITIATALLSLVRNVTINRPLAMTGELTLTGRVFRVGGIREKVISARRQKILELVLPADNESDYLQLPDYVRDGLTVHFVKTYAEVEKIVFGAA